MALPRTKKKTSFKNLLLTKDVQGSSKSRLDEGLPLLKLVATYLSRSEYSVSYRQGMLRTARKCQQHEIAEPSDLNTESINAMLAGLSECGLGATTRSNIRRELMTLWRFASDLGHCDFDPSGVIRIRAVRSPTVCWSSKELARIATAAENDNTLIGGRIEMRICDYLPCWIGVSYDTGLRFTDVWTLHRSEIDGDSIRKVAAKTGKPLVRGLSQETSAAVSKLLLLSPDGTLFKWFLTRRRAFLSMRKFLDRHQASGSGKWLRRSCATAIERDRPGMASAYLQHSSPSLLKHYVDESLLRRPDGPPPIRRSMIGESERM